MLRISTATSTAWTPVKLWRRRAASDRATDVGFSGGAGAAGPGAAHVGNAPQGLGRAWFHRVLQGKPW